MLDNVIHDISVLHTDIPSWVPAWDAKGMDESSGTTENHLGKPVLLPATGLNRNPQVVNEKLLRVHGVILDVFEFVTEPLEASMTTKEFVYHLWLQIYNTTHLLMHTREYPAEFLFEFLTKHRMIGQPDMWISGKTAYIDMLNRPFAQVENFKWSEQKGSHIAIDYVYGWMRKKKRKRRGVSVNKRGYVGLAPAATHQGDMCGIVFGCMYP